MGTHSSAYIDVSQADPELADAIDEAPSPRPPRVQEIRLQQGGWDGAGPRTSLGLLLLAGFLIRRVELTGRHSIELLGPGDVLRPFELERDRYAMVPSDASWRALEPVRLAVLDERFAGWVAQRPHLVDRLLSRVLRRSRTLALRLALVQLPRASARLHFLLWHLADRFGRVQRDRVLLPVPLSHAMLAELVSAQRPPVSRAMKELERLGLLSPAPDGGWYLHGRPPAQVAPASSQGLGDHESQ
jgi:CRP/FNR family transcriptional regulator, cyclic AMP receptor protein